MASFKQRYPHGGQCSLPIAGRGRRLGAALAGAVMLLSASVSPAAGQGKGLIAARQCKTAHIQWGVNFHVPPDKWDKVQDVMAERNISLIRLGVSGIDSVRNARMRSFAVNLAKQGIGASAIIFTSYSKGYPLGNNCESDLKAVERKSYDETLKAIGNIDDVVHDFELQNEVPLYPGLLAPGAKGTEASDFDTPCGRLQAANMRGMSRAIADERQRTGQPLRVVLGTVSRSFGFLKFMQAQGVNFDVVGYHIYPKESNKELDEDPWFGQGGALGQLARFGKPVHLNEFHCAEIYSKTYENKAQEPETEACLRGMTRHLKRIVRRAADLRIEAIYFYELTDEPNAKPPESHFGLMYDLDHPKVNLYVLSAFAGGKLAPAELQALLDRRLVTAKQVSAWAGCGVAPGS